MSAGFEFAPINSYIVTVLCMPGKTCYMLWPWNVILEMEIIYGKLNESSSNL